MDSDERERSDGTSGLDRLTALAGLRLAGTEGRDLPWLLDRIALTVTDLLPADGGASVILWDRSTETFTLSASTVARQTAETTVQRVRQDGGATRHIVDEGRPVIVEDTAHDPFVANRMLREASLRSYVGVPIAFAEDRLGVLYAMSRAPRTYSADDIVFLELVAASAAHAIASTRQRLELNAALRETRALLRVSRSLMAAQQLDDVLDETVRAGAEVFAADRIVLLGLDHDAEQVVQFVTGGRRGAEIPRMDYAHYMGGLTGEAVRAGAVVRSTAERDDERESPEARALRDRLQATGVMVAPLRVRGSVLGTLTVIRAAGQPDFTLHDEELLESVAGQASVALERALLYRKARQLATTDELTGVHNRRELLRLAERKYARARVTRRPLGALLVDVDHFKAVNDLHGHSAGDDVLREISRLGAAAVRDIDVFGRYGGEEFLVLLPECDQDEARRVADRLRRTVASTAFDVGETERSLTISLGLAVAAPWTDDLEPAAGVERLIAAADDALYRAKAAGRDRVEVAD